MEAQQGGKSNSLLERISFVGFIFQLRCLEVNFLKLLQRCKDISRHVSANDENLPPEFVYKKMNWLEELGEKQEYQEHQLDPKKLLLVVT